MRLPAANPLRALSLGATLLFPQLLIHFGFVDLNNTRVATAAKPTNTGDDELYEKRIRPLLVDNCYECHSAGAKTIEAGLRLDTRDGWLKGGVSGAAIVPGDPDASRLIRAIRYVDHDLEMPPIGKLKPAEIALLESWVKAGAPGPGSSTETKPAASQPAQRPSTRSEHWAFQSYKKPALPDVLNTSAVRSDLDRFVVSALEKKLGASLDPSIFSEADRHTWLRRVTWDLTGLPPTAAELQDFEADTSANAFEHVVDRLLASNAYGERWARLWLDSARYADSNGLDENLAIANAWRYRDYVIRAFNQDKPYNQFVTEQLAGDLLPEPAESDKNSEAQLRDQLTATAFLVLGPKMLAEQDKEKLLMDTVDEQIDVTSKTFLGLTAACARCHDHKFDPIPTRDYYALAGIFRSTSTFENTAFVSRWRQLELKNAEARRKRDEWNTGHDKAEKDWKEKLQKAEGTLSLAWRRDFARILIAASSALRNTTILQAEEPSRGTLGVDRETWGNKYTTIARTTTGGTQYAEYDLTVPAAVRQELWVRMASAEPRPMKILLNGETVEASALGETTGSFHPEGQQWFHAATLPLKPGRNVVRLEGTAASVPHLDVLAFAPASETPGDSLWPLTTDSLAEGLDRAVVRQCMLSLHAASRAQDPLWAIWNRLVILAPEDFTNNIYNLWYNLREESAAGKLKAPAPILALLEAPAPASLTEFAARMQSVLTTVEIAWQSELELAVKQKREAPRTLSNTDLESVRQVWHGEWGPLTIPRHELESIFPEEQRAGVLAARAELDAFNRRKPEPFDRCPGVQEGAPADLPVHVRGSHLNKSADAVPRGFLSVLDRALPAPAIAAKSSGRLELAHWITDPRNPLTARVMVNRIWLGHFGEGIVRTPSNFGLRGAEPDNPDLLNWLASEFVEHGWSVKTLHRKITLSATYRRTSHWNAAAGAADPENRTLWRMNRRRLDAESIRDCALAVSGKLDRKEGGTLLMIADGEYVTNDQSQDQARYSTPRRSIYLPIIRNSMFDLFTTFDYNDASISTDRRPSTTAAPQSLFLLNSPLMVECAEKLAVDARATAKTDDERIAWLWKQILLRAPRDAERERASTFLAQARSLERGTVPPVTAGGESAKPAPSPASEEAIDAAVWRGLAQVLLASNEFLFVD